MLFNVSRYRDLIEEGRHQFQKEIVALLPHVSLGQADGGAQLTEEELNLFVTHAYQVRFRHIVGLGVNSGFEECVRHFNLKNDNFR